jgi:hypothetical protein
MFTGWPSRRSISGRSVFATLTHIEQSASLDRREVMCPLQSILCGFRYSKWTYYGCPALSHLTPVNMYHFRKVRDSWKEGPVRAVHR